MVSTLNKVIEKINKIPLTFAFLLYELIVTCRIFMEMGKLPLAGFIFQLFWFNSVVVIFFISAKYLLKIDQKRLSILAFGGFLTLIPILHSLLFKIDLSLNFIQPVSVKQLLTDLFTLLAYHPYDYPMFLELLLLLISFALLGWILSGHFFKALLTSFFATYVSFFIMGFSWIAVNPHHLTLFLLSSDLRDEQFYALKYITTFTLFSMIAFYRELLNFIKEKVKWFEILLFLLFSLSLDFFFLFLKKSNFLLPDILILFLPSLALLSFFLILYKKAYKMLFLPSWISLGTLLVLLF